MSMRQMETALIACRQDYQAAIDNLRDLVFMERRAVTMEEQVRRDRAETMISMIDAALVPATDEHGIPFRP